MLPDRGWYYPFTGNETLPVSCICGELLREGDILTPCPIHGWVGEPRKEPDMHLDEHGPGYRVWSTATGQRIEQRMEVATCYMRVRLEASDLAMRHAEQQVLEDAHDRASSRTDEPIIPPKLSEWQEEDITDDEGMVVGRVLVIYARAYYWPRIPEEVKA